MSKYLNTVKSYKLLSLYAIRLVILLQEVNGSFERAIHGFLDFGLGLYKKVSNEPLCVGKNIRGHHG